MNSGGNIISRKKLINFSLLFAQPQAFIITLLNLSHGGNVDTHSVWWVHLIYTVLNNVPRSLYFTDPGPVS
jgi:hypothetical protein